MFEDINAKCPYFVCSDERTIRCMGVIEGSNTEIRFSKVIRLPKHRYNFCDSDCWEGCPVAQMISEEFKD